MFRCRDFLFHAKSAPTSKSLAVSSRRRHHFLAGSRRSEPSDPAVLHRRTGTGARIVGGNPSVRDTHQVSVKVIDQSNLAVLYRRAVAEENLGAYAVNGALSGMRACSDLYSDVTLTVIMAPVCALIGTIAGASAGAAESGTSVDIPEKAPSGNIPNKHDWLERFQSILEDEGRRHGKDILPFPRGITVNAVIESLHWNVDGGATASIQGEFSVVVGVDGRFRKASVTHSGPDLAVADWLRGSGERVDAGLESFFAQVAEKIWETVDGE